LVEAIAEAAEVLTAEQRTKLVELVEHRPRHARWH
jgi:Spy/CpxP family protein refolding chaperone